MEEIIIKYPESWEREYREKGFVSKWIDEFPKMFEDYLNCCTLRNSLSTRLGTLDLFAQYCLMYLLRKDCGFHSLTWFKMGLTNQKSINWHRSQKYWRIMTKWMGDNNFEKLRSSILDAGLGGGFKGEPDLFCWKSKTGKWFFAEAKNKDHLSETQLKWFQISENLTGSKVKVYRLTPSI